MSITKKKVTISKSKKTISVAKVHPTKKELIETTKKVFNQYSHAIKNLKDR